MDKENDAGKGRPEESAAVPKGYWVAMLGTVLVLAAAVALAVRGSGTPQRAAEQSSGQALEKPTTPAAAKKLDSKTLLGRWVRTDTPYVIDIQEAGEDGTLKARYFNPQPIHVARADAAEKDGKLTVFVELRDTNYPGCTYKLTYEKSNDTLAGTYYQAALQQEYEIAFAREPEGK
ncbi:MAG: hypothetical protein NTW87_21375 [Planctomycetota bacterium]|nr:hypothetical protein [Planctomycetota bacterium]